MPLKILILCTGNSCRSQMAEFFLRSFDPALEVYSAGTDPAIKIMPFTKIVMQEAGIDLSHAYPKNVSRFLNDSFDYVITVCDHANEVCPVFPAKVKHRLHMGFDDPASARGTDEQILSAYRRVRDLMRLAFHQLYTETLSKEK